MNTNAEIQNALNAYHIAGLTSQQIQQKVEKYALTHIFALHKDAVQANNDFQAGNYQQVGHEAGAILQAIFGNGRFAFGNLRDDKDTLQLIFNGFFEEGGLPDPTTVVNCFDDTSATLTVQTIGKLLDQVAHNKFTDAQNTAKAFGNQLPDSVKTCLKTNAEIQAALSAYHIAGLSSADIQKKVEKYVAGHLISLHKDCSRANDDFKDGKYAQVGHDAGSLVHKIFGNGMTVYGDDRDTLQQLFNGFFEQAGLADPTTVVQCFDDSSATLTVQTLGTILTAAAKNDINGATNAAKNYMSQLPQPVQDCMKNNAEIQNALTAYHLTGLTPQEIQQKVEKYALTHIFALHKAAVQANNDFQAGNYNQVGHEAGAILQAIFGNGMRVYGDDRDTLQQLFNGFFEQAGLADPTTVVQCFDDSSATLTVQTLGTILTAAAKNDINGATNAAKNYIAQLPQPVQDCMKNNAEIQTALTAYHLTGLTPQEIQQKVEKYALTHIFALHKAAVQANNDFQAGKYNQVGHEAGAILQAIFGNGMRVYGDDRDTLQQLFNGFFEQANLADPTTVVQCFDDSSATLTVQTLGTILTAAAKNDINGATNAAKNYISQLPQPVQDCMKNNAEIQTALSAYHLAGLTPQEIQQKVEKYALTHIFALHKAAVQANNDFQAGKYNQVGHEAGAILQAIFGNGMRGYTDDAQTLQLLFNGFFEQAGLADPTTVVQCFDDSSATLTVQTLGTILAAAAKNDIAGAENAAKNYMAQLPQPVQDCMKNNAEIQNALTAYHIAGLTSQQIQQKVEKYALTHFIALHKDAVQANNDFQAGNYQQVGHEAGAILQAIFGNGMTFTDDRDTLQQLFNGFFEQANLADPTTVVQCFDDSSATLTVQALGTILAAAAKNDITGVENAAKNYMAELPQPVQDCLKTNAEIQSVLSAYHLTGLTPQQIQQKVEKYALSHLFQLHHDAVQANNDFVAGNYNQVGKEAGDILQKIFASKNRPNFQAIRDAQTAKLNGNPFQELVQVFAGFWSQAGLPQPTTPITCFELDTADVTIKFIGQLALDLANDEFVDFDHAVDNYKTQVPQTVLDCFFGDSQVAVIEKSYGVQNMTISMIESKLATYALSHYKDFHNVSVAINQNFQMGKYEKTGKFYGQLLQNMIAN
jgi:phosphoglycerate dehydrogenase-like enzyme